LRAGVVMLEKMLMAVCLGVCLGMLGATLLRYLAHQELEGQQPELDDSGLGSELGWQLDALRAQLVKSYDYQFARPR
jgi:hypothetical protein